MKLIAIIIVSCIPFFIGCSKNPLGDGKTQSEFENGFQPGLPNPPDSDSSQQTPSHKIRWMKLSPGAIQSKGSSASANATVTINQRLATGLRISGYFSINQNSK